MAWYDVTIVYSASKVIRVEAESVDEAKEVAMDEAGFVSLCHQCADEVELSDAIEATDAWEVED